MTSSLVICLIIFFLMIIGFLFSNKISMAATSLIAMLLLVVTGCIDADTALAGFANSSTIVMASMFVVSAGFSKTKMVPKLASLVRKVSKGNFTKALAGFVIITTLLTQFIQSAIACFSIVIPLACVLCDEMGWKRTKIVFPIAIVAISTITILPIGNAAITYISANAKMEALGFVGYEWKMLDNTIGRLPGMIMIMLYAIFLAPKLCPDKPVTEMSELAQKKSSEKVPLKPAQEVIGSIAFWMVPVLLITQSLHKIPAWEVTLFAAILMAVSGILKPKETYNAIGLGGMVLLYVGNLAMANALANTGAATILGDFLTALVGNTRNNYLIGFFFFIVPFLLTQIMMNAAVRQIFSTITYLACLSMGCNPIGPSILCTVASLSAFMTPMATPCVPMMMGLGGYDQKTLFKMGWIPAVLLCVVNVLWVMTIFPAF